MGGQNKLTAVKPYGIRQKLRELFLIFNRQTVFRFIKKKERILRDLLRKKLQRTFSVGLHLNTAPDPFPHIAGHGFSFRVQSFFKAVIIRHTPQVIILGTLCNVVLK